MSSGKEHVFTNFPLCFDLIVISLMYFWQDLTMTVVRDKRTLHITVQPVDLATRLKEIKNERQQQLLQEKLRSQEYGPFRTSVEKMFQ